MQNLHFVSPLFIVANLRESLTFYREKLGFGVLHTSPEEEPYFAMIGRNGVSLMLKGDGVPKSNSSLYDWARLDAYISTADPEALYEEYKAKGVTFRQQLQVDSDNLLGFDVVDVNGYVLFFGRPNV